MPAEGPPRERIMSEASRLLARDRQASVEDIAIAAGVSRTTFYRAFPSRAQLLRAIDLQPEPDTRDRVLQASIRMLGTQSLKELSMDSLAYDARVQPGLCRHGVARLRNLCPISGGSDGGGAPAAHASDARCPEPGGWRDVSPAGSTGHEPERGRCSGR